MSRFPAVAVGTLILVAVGVAMNKGAHTTQREAGEPTVIKFPTACNYIAQNYLGGLYHDAAISQAKMNQMGAELDACVARQKEAKK